MPKKTLRVHTRNVATAESGVPVIPSAGPCRRSRRSLAFGGTHRGESRSKGPGGSWQTPEDLPPVMETCPEFMISYDNSLESRTWIRSTKHKKIAAAQKWMFTQTVMIGWYPKIYPKSENDYTQMIHVWYIYLHLHYKWPSFVGRYTSTMDHLGYLYHVIFV